MAKLIALDDSQSVTIASGQASSILRDISQNDVGTRITAYLGADAANPFAQFPGQIQGTPSALESASALAAFFLTQSLTASAGGVVDLVINKKGSGYQISHASFGDGTPAAMASSAYGDPSRTTFSSIQDFARCVHQNGAFADALESALMLMGPIDAVVIDQVEQRTYVVHQGALGASESGTLQIPVAGVQFDDAVSVQYGE